MQYTRYAVLATAAIGVITNAGCLDGHPSPWDYSQQSIANLPRLPSGTPIRLEIMLGSRNTVRTVGPHICFSIEDKLGHQAAGIIHKGAESPHTVESIKRAFKEDGIIVLYGIFENQELDVTRVYSGNPTITLYSEQ